MDCSAEPTSIVHYTSLWVHYIRKVYNPIEISAEKHINHILKPHIEVRSGVEWGGGDMYPRFQVRYEAHGLIYHCFMLQS